jgi:hypothetical protein
MAEKSLTVLQWKMSITHPMVDICDMHANLNKYALGAGCYPKELAPKPPAHPHCLLGDSLITASGRISAVSKRWFDGNIVVITTASGKRLSATVNHPILTPGGWVGAGLLNVGDKVISRVDSIAVSRPCFIDDEHQDVPASIAEIADAFSRSGEVTAREVPITAENFHGDGMAGQVAVIWSDGELGYGVNATTAQVGDNHFLKVAQPAFAGLLGESVFDLGFKASGNSSHSIVSVSGEGGTLIGSELRHPDELSLGNASDAQAFGYDDVVDWPSADIQFLGNREDGTPILVLGDSVIADRITDAKRINYSGHVYNLETEYGHYTSNGIITHNCRCKLVPRWDLDAANAKPRAKAEQAYLIDAGDKDGAKIMGSAEKWAKAKSGKATVEEILNAGKDPLYHMARVGDVGDIGLAASEAAQQVSPALAKSDTLRRLNADLLLRAKSGKKNIEYGGVIGKEGELLFTKQGGKSYISFSESEMALMDGGILSHNHPEGRSLSMEDMSLVIRKNLSRIYAIGNNGSIYAASVKYGITVNELTAARSNAAREIRSSFLEKISKDEITASDAGKYHDHAVNLLTSKTGMISYHAAVKGGTPQWVYDVVRRIKL